MIAAHHHRLVGRIVDVERASAPLEDGRTVHALTITLEQIMPLTAGMPVQAVRTWDSTEADQCDMAYIDLMSLAGHLVAITGCGMGVTASAMPILLGVHAWAQLGEAAEEWAALAHTAAAIGHARASSKREALP